jgi:hypothetical protein
MGELIKFDGVFSQLGPAPQPDTASVSIPSRCQFTEKPQKYPQTFRAFISGVFPDFPWGPMVLAGGTLVSFAYGLPVRDYDFFLVGKSPNEAARTITRLSQYLKPKTTFVYKTNFAITFILSDQVKVQVIFRSHPSAYNVLERFDLKICRFLYDGKDIFYWPGALNA